MSISRTHQPPPPLPPALRPAAAPTADAPPRPPAPAVPAAAPVPVPIPAPVAAPYAAAVAGRSFARREPGLVVLLAALVLGAAALLVPDALQRAAVLASLGLLVAGVALLVFVSPVAAAPGVRPLHRREPWLAALLASVAAALSVAAVPPGLRTAAASAALGLLALGLLLLALRRRDPAEDADALRADRAG